MTSYFPADMLPRIVKAVILHNKGTMFKKFQYKERPDLLPDAPRKNGFFLFWELYIRKFWRLVTVNLLYFVVTLPLIVIVYTIFGNYIYNLTQDIELAKNFVPGLLFFQVLFINEYVPLPVFYSLACISFLLYGPATMGATYVYRNFAREEHAWVSDFFSKGISNLRQGIILGIIDVILLISLATTALGGFTYGAETDILTIIVKSLARIGIVIYLFARHYIFLQAVTIRLNIMQIILNSLRFVLLGFWRNIIALVTSAAVTVVLLLLHTYVTYITLPFLFYSFTGFLTIFTVYPVLKKYIVDPATRRDDEPENAEETE